MYEFFYDYMKSKYGHNVKLCYMDTDSFIMNIKTEDFYKMLLMMLKKDLILQIILQERIIAGIKEYKSNWFNER